MNINKAIVIALLSGAMSAGAHAAVATSSSGFNVIEDFESFDGLVTKGPTLLAGGISFSSDVFSTVGAAAVDLVDNGTWGAGNRFAGIGDLSFIPTTSEGFVGQMVFTFAGPMSSIGALFSIFNDGSVTGEITLEALDAANAVLEATTFVIDLNDPFATNAGTFRGFVRGSSDIAALRVSGDGFVVDNLSAVPVPAALPLLMGGLGLLGVRFRRRTAA